MPKTILFISNGYGEDVVSSSLIKLILEKDPLQKISVLPVVGEGKAFEGLPVEKMGPCKTLPSQGILCFNLRNSYRDLRAGLLSLFYEQVKFLLEVSPKVKLTVAIGDTLVAGLGGLFVRKPVVFVGLAKSNYLCNYGFLEKLILRSFCVKVFPRDQVTASALVKAKVKAEYLGNPMMDCFTVTGEDFGIKKKHVVAVLPGSRDTAYTDFAFILGATDHIFTSLNGEVEFLIALSSSLSLEEMVKQGEKADWQCFPSDRGAVLRKESGLTVQIILGRFGDVINTGHIVIGRAGTANEQAAGLGKPIVTFDWEQKSFVNWYELRQKGLLDGAVMFVKRKRDEVASAVVNLLKNPEKVQQMGRVGRQRMGERGGLRKIANEILYYLERE